MRPSDIWPDISVACLQKLVFFDLKVTLEFEGLPLPSSTAVKGSIKIEEYSTASEEVNV
jgi:hypothetical protein